MKKAILSLLVFAVHSSVFAGALNSGCPTCLKELPIHLAGGFFSTFGAKIGHIKTIPDAEAFKAISLDNLRKAFEENQGQAFQTAVEVKKLRSSGAILDYEVDGKMKLPDGTDAKVLRHTYLYPSDTEAFYLFELEDSKGRQLKMLGDASDPLSAPVFWGIIYDSDDRALYAVQIWGRTGAEAERTLQRFERFVLDKSRLPSSSKPKKEKAKKK